MGFSDTDINAINEEIMDMVDAFTSEGYACVLRENALIVGGHTPPPKTKYKATNITTGEYMGEIYL